MNTNTIAEYTSVRCRGISTNGRSNILVQGKTKKIKNVVIKTVSIMKWLLSPESENEQPLFESRLANIWANTAKSLFWIGAAICMGFLVAQLT